MLRRVLEHRERRPDGKREWTVLVSDLKREKGRRLWQRYHQRGGTIEKLKKVAAAAIKHHAGTAEEKKAEKKAKSEPKKK